MTWHPDLDEFATIQKSEKVVNQGQREYIIFWTKNVLGGIRTYLCAPKIGESNGIFFNMCKNIFREMANFLLHFFHFSFPFSSTKLCWNLSSLPQLSNDTKIISIEQRLPELLRDFTKYAKLKKTDFSTWLRPWLRPWLMPWID